MALGSVTCKQFGRTGARKGVTYLIMKIKPSAAFTVFMINEVQSVS